jgi:lysozyme family protein
MSAFDTAFGIIVCIEAGYDNGPKDPGGETKYGCSKHRYPRMNPGLQRLAIADVIAAKRRVARGRIG